MPLAFPRILRSPLQVLRPLTPAARSILLTTFLQLHWCLTCWGMQQPRAYFQCRRFLRVRWQVGRPPTSIVQFQSQQPYCSTICSADHGGQVCLAPAAFQLCFSRPNTWTLLKMSPSPRLLRPYLRIFLRASSLLFLSSFLSSCLPFCIWALFPEQLPSPLSPQLPCQASPSLHVLALLSSKRLSLPLDLSRLLSIPLPSSLPAFSSAASTSAFCFASSSSASRFALLSVASLTSFSLAS